MKKLTTLFIVSLLILSCENSIKTESVSDFGISEKSYMDYKELEYLEHYDKVSDTSYAKEGYDSTHRITLLKQNDELLVLFSEISLDDKRNEIKTILDTLVINKINNNSFVTIGYCDYENMLWEEVIALVEKTETDTIQKIIKAWKANSETNKIEEIRDLRKIKCWNEF